MNQINLTALDSDIAELHLNTSYYEIEPIATYLNYPADLKEPFEYLESLIRLINPGIYTFKATLDCYGISAISFLAPIETPFELGIYGYNIDEVDPINVNELHLLNRSLLSSQLVIVGDTTTIVPYSFQTVVAEAKVEALDFTHVGVELVLPSPVVPIIITIDTRVKFMGSMLESFTV